VKLRRRGDGVHRLQISQWPRVDCDREDIAAHEHEFLRRFLRSRAREKRLLNWTTFDKVREAPKLVNDDFTPQSNW
jgi:hypothetical protein